MLLSESVLALTLVTSIEEEFEMEFEDDELDINFFSSINTIIEKLDTHISNEKTPFK